MGRCLEDSHLPIRLLHEACSRHLETVPGGRPSEVRHVDDHLEAVPGTAPARSDLPEVEVALHDAPPVVVEVALHDAPLAAAPVVEFRRPVRPQEVAPELLPY